MFKLFVCFSVISSFVAAHPFLQGRVVNGIDVDDGEFPFAISLRYAPHNSHACGGSIIHPEWILTAAHCVPAVNPSNYNIQYGNADITVDSMNIAYVEEVFPHEGYQPVNQYIHDIALIKLRKPLAFGETITAIELPEQGEETPKDSLVTLVGWGLNATDGPLEPMARLQRVDLKSFSYEDCANLHYKKIHTTNICAGVEEGGKGQCNGDSGGPLMYQGKVVGVVSWSEKPCTVFPYPGVYTKVSAYRDWIRETTGF